MKRKINFKERICECCGKLYKPTCATQKWCSECGPSMRKEMQKKYTEEHKEETKVRRARYESDPKNKEHKLEYNRKRYQEKREEILAKNKIYREEHKEEKREQDRKYREEHKEEINRKNRERRLNNLEEHRRKGRERVANFTQEQKEARKQYKKQYYETNKEDILSKQKAKRDLHKDEVNTKARERYHKNIEESRRKQREYSKRPEVKDRNNKRRRERRRTDIIFHLKERMRKYIGRCLHSKKDKHTFDIIGYSSEQLCSHLEAQFTEDMNWENYVTYWSIDHIKPLDAFNFFNEDGSVNYDVVAEANALVNLRPLRFAENSIKSSTWTEEDEIEYQKRIKKS